jgi:hypothetical protein
MNLQDFACVFVLIIVLHYLLNNLNITVALKSNTTTEHLTNNELLNQSNQSNQSNQVSENNEYTVEQELYEHAIQKTDKQVVEGFTPNDSSIQSNTYLPHGLPVKNKTFDNDNCNLEIKPLNTFENTYNAPNFTSECAYPQGYYSLDKEGEHYSFYDDKLSEHPKLEKKMQVEEVPRSWQYDNEIPMNGGAIFNDVCGLDETSDSLAMFDANNVKLDSKFYQTEDKQIAQGMGNKTVYN